MKNGVLGAAIETQMNTQLLFCIHVNAQMVKLGIYFADFNFRGSRLNIRRKLDNAKISHFTVFLKSA